MDLFEARHSHAAGQTAMGLCPFAAGFMHTALRYAAAGIIVTTECDQMRRVRAVSGASSRAALSRHVPATWETPASHRLYRDELARLSRFLASIGGTAPCKTTLIEIMNDYEQRRRAFHSIVALLPARDYVRARVAFTRRAQFAATGYACPTDRQTAGAGGRAAPV
ncbi:2-hydroxyacyl-CoA dehydratase [bacterium]|nr:2-hydroxyacyl-CoA dehydratase [bacterium]